MVIPLYNAEKYIRQCLLSVLGSKFQNYEVLVVNDCSTDNSVDEVKKLMPHFDGRLKILSTRKNSGGPGIPRNIGVKNAAGKYVTFVDNDDMILPTALGDFFELAEKFQAEVIHTDRYYAFRDELADGNFNLAFDGAKEDLVTEPTLLSEDIWERIGYYSGGKFLWAPWGKFFRRDFLIKNKIEFPQVKFSEDMVFCLQTVCLAKKYLLVPNITNIYRVTDTSASKGFTWLTWFIVTTKVINVIETFMNSQEIFKRSAELRLMVIKFCIDKSFEFISMPKGLVPHEVMLELFYKELQNPNLDPKGKNLISAYVWLEKVMNQTR